MNASSHNQTFPFDTPTQKGRLIVVLGNVSAGKTTLARRIAATYDLRRVSTDDYRRLPSMNDDPYVAAVRATVHSLRRGESVVFDDVAQRGCVRDMIDATRDLGYPTLVIRLECDRQTQASRDAGRDDRPPLEEKYYIWSLEGSRAVRADLIIDTTIVSQSDVFEDLRKVVNEFTHRDFRETT